MSADRSVAGAGNPTDRSVAGAGTQTTTTVTTGSDVVTSYSTPSTSKSSASAAAKKKQEEEEKKQQEQTQAQINNTAAINKYRKGDLDKITKNRTGDINAIAKARQDEMDQAAQMQLNSILQQRQDNDAALAARQAQIMRGVDWQSQQQKEQSMLANLRNRMGNSAYGSSIQDLAQNMARIDDMADVQLLEAWKQNEDLAYNDWFKTDEQLAADYNNQVASILDEFSQFKSDYSDQYSKQQREYENEISKLYTNYWTTESNLNAQLASKSNMEKSAKGKTNTQKISEAKEVSKAMKKIAKDPGSIQQFLTGADDWLINKYGKAGELIIDVYKKLDKGKGIKTDAFKKAINEAADSYVSKVTNKYTASTGTGTDKYTLPNVDLTTLAKMPQSILLGPSSALSKMLATQTAGDSYNPRTRNFVRGAGAQEAYGGSSGSVDMSKAANTGFTDNLSPFNKTVANTASSKSGPALQGIKSTVNTTTPTAQTRVSFTPSNVSNKNKNSKGSSGSSSKDNKSGTLKVPDAVLKAATTGASGVQNKASSDSQKRTLEMSNLSTSQSSTLKVPKAVQKAANTGSSGVQNKTSSSGKKRTSEMSKLSAPKSSSKKGGKNKKKK